MFREEYEFKGKHAKYAKFLKNIGVVKSYNHLYGLSALLGFMYSKKEDIDNEKDSTDKVISASILPSEILSVRDELLEVYRIIMLLDEVPGYEIQDYQTRVFKIPEDDKKIEEQKEAMRIFNAYSRGGVTILYNKFANIKESSQKKEIVDSIKEFVVDFIKE